MPSRWVIVIPRMVKMDLTSSSGSVVPPVPAPAAASSSPAANAAVGF